MPDSRTLADWLVQLEAGHPVKWDLGLERVSEVARRLDVLDAAPQIALVAGTNGKGTTCEYLNALAIASGRKVGLATSPHLRRFNERVRVQGKPASDAELVEAFGAIERARAEISLTYFEHGALAALILFKEAGVDLAVLEIGLGARLDAMNIVEPSLSIITAISMDHQAWLGDTREAIGREKAGALRRGKPCVLADPAPPESVLQEAERLQCPLYLLGRDFGFAQNRLHWRDATGQAQSLEGLPTPALPPESIAAAVQAGALLGLDTRPASLCQVAGARLEGRNQLLPGPPDWLLDVAHNPAAAERLAQAVQRLAPAGRRVHAIAGIYADKDLAGILAPLAPLVCSWRFCDLPEERAAPAAKIKAALPPAHASRAQTCGSIASAVSQLQGDCGPEDLLLAFGSFPLVAGALELLDPTDEDG